MGAAMTYPTVTTMGGDVAGIPLDALGIGSGWLLLCLFLIGFYRAMSNGRLITRREADGIEEAASQAVERAEHDRDEWRAEGRIKDAQIAEKDQQLAHMAEVGQLVRDIMRALQRTSREVER